MNRSALVVLLLALVAVAASPAHVAAAEPANTVILVRHAETAGDTRSGGGDPALSEAGTARAAALARLLGDAGVTHLFASEFARTRATLAPLAAAAGLAVVSVPAARTADQLAALRALPAGSVAVVAGHSNTVPVLVAGLGGTMTGLAASERHGALIPHAEYDRLVFVVPVPGAAASTTIEIRYGD